MKMKWWEKRKSQVTQFSGYWVSGKATNQQRIFQEQEQMRGRWEEVFPLGYTVWATGKILEGNFQPFPRTYHGVIYNSFIEV
jgi:hypothetical protein